MFNHWLTVVGAMAECIVSAYSAVDVSGVDFASFSVRMFEVLGQADLLHTQQDSLDGQGLLLQHGNCRATLVSTSWLELDLSTFNPIDGQSTVQFSFA